ncbi:helix-turn-helix domain-containing protein [Polycladidibacter stylochi]|uniref:helix-turn-helix domain-containing protein n=1 Tax=Polycladidibacter stylochi TaxID=1807766 RepID=UPI00082ECCCB|nr:helix-turn-helix transcriptional regulator [Pseudovibrio stylochi]
MLSLPLPIIISLLIMLGFLHFLFLYGWQNKALVFIAIGFYALQMFLVGIRWSSDLIPQTTIAITALVLPPLTWGALRQLAGHANRKVIWQTVTAAFFAALLMFITTLTSNSYWVDALVIIVYASFGIALLFKASPANRAWFDTSPLIHKHYLRYLYIGAGGVLCFSALTDISITLAFTYGKSFWAGQMVVLGNALWVCTALAGYFYFILQRKKKQQKLQNAQPRHEEVGQQAQEKSQTISVDEKALGEALSQLHQLLSDEQLYRDENISLDRLANKLSLSPRLLSRSVNQLKGMSLPQFINTYRLQEAGERLQSSEETITQIMYGVGFATKSNFNREFIRYYGMNPSQYRTAGKSAPSKTPVTL